MVDEEAPAESDGAKKPVSGQSPWRNAGWIAALAGLITAVGSVVANFMPEGPKAEPAPSALVDESAEAGPSTQPKSQLRNDDLTVAVGQYESNDFDPWAGEVFLLPPGGVSPNDIPNNVESVGAYVSSCKGINAGDHSVALLLRASDDRTVVITSIEPRIVERNLPQTGVLLRGNGGCGPLPVRIATFDFDSNPPSVSYQEEDGAESVNHLALSVTQKEPEVVAVLAKSQTDDVLWTIIIAYEVDGVQKSFEVTDKGNPFRVTGAAPQTPVYQYNFNEAVTRESDMDSSPFTWC